MDVTHDEAMGSEREPTFAFEFDIVGQVPFVEAESYL
jgi:hypothetical protein